MARWSGSVVPSTPDRSWRLLTVGSTPLAFEVGVGFEIRRIADAAWMGIELRREGELAARCGVQASPIARRGSEIVLVGAPLRGRCQRTADADVRQPGRSATNEATPRWHGQNRFDALERCGGSWSERPGSGAGEAHRSKALKLGEVASSTRPKVAGVVAVTYVLWRAPTRRGFAEERSVEVAARDDQSFAATAAFDAFRTLARRCASSVWSRRR